MSESHANTRSRYGLAYMITSLSRCLRWWPKHLPPVIEVFNFLQQHPEIAELTIWNTDEKTFEDQWVFVYHKLKDQDPATFALAEEYHTMMCKCVMWCGQ
jgi:hypothetical protein